MPLQLQLKHTKFVHAQMGLFQVQVALIQHRHPSIHRAPYLCRIIALQIPSQPPSSSLLLLILHHFFDNSITPDHDIGAWYNKYFLENLRNKQHLKKFSELQNDIIRKAGRICVEYRH